MFCVESHKTEMLDNQRRTRSCESVVKLVWSSLNGRPSCVPLTIISDPDLGLGMKGSPYFIEQP